SRKEPSRPLISFAPYENAIAAQSRKRFSADDVRHAIYWSLFLTPPAGISYGGPGRVDWGRTGGGGGTGALPFLDKAMFMPAAKQMATLSKFVATVESWRLRPRPNFINAQPGSASPRRFLAAGGTESKDLAIVYAPEDRTLEILLDALPSAPTVTW